MRHFFLDRLDEKGYILDPVDIHHMSKVLRMTRGEELQLAYRGDLYHGKIEQIDKKMIVINIERKIARSPYPRIHLYQALAKGKKMEHILQHGTELGISKFGLVPTRYSDVKSVSKKKERYLRILKDAAKQSQSSDIPEIVFYEGLEQIPFDEDEIFFCYELEKENKITIQQKGSVGIIVGPEGGFSQKEASFMKSKAQAVSLGERVLRTETAGFVATALILREFGVL